MRKLAIFLIFAFITLEAKQVTKDAKIFGQEMLSSIPDALNTNLKNVITNEEFDANQAKNGLSNQELPNNKILDFVLSPEVSANLSNTGFEDEEAFLQVYQEIDSKADEMGIYKTETCRRGGAPSAISLTRTLSIESSYKPEESSIFYKCLLHEEKKHYHSENKAKKKAKKLEDIFSKDPTIKSYSVDISGGWFFKKYEVRWNWTHFDNTETCNKKSEIKKVTHPESFEITKEEWIYENPKILEKTKSPLCTFLDKTCLESDASKFIHGKEIHRQCWKEKLTYICESDQINECSFLKNSHCEEVSRKCLSEGPFGCNLWELTFKCLAAKKRNAKGADSINIDEELSNQEYIPNDSFAEVSTKLLLFDQIKKEIEKTESSDARKIEIFSGNSERCEKSVAEDLFYDCCFSFKGLANELKLTHCNAKELALSEKREKGFCHYIGSKEEKLLGLRTKDVHVFCCFESKLSRVFQQQAKEQLNIDWGPPKNPNCRGIHTEELKRLDFSKLDLTEVYEESINQSASIEQKLDNFRKNLRDRLEKENASL